MLTYQLHHLHQLPQIAAQLLTDLGSRRTLALYGNLGAGKTTLVQAFAAQLGATDMVSSPTYSLVNEYDLPNGKIYHLDLYRLPNIHEALAIGIEDYLDAPNAYCFVEWPGVVAPILPPDTAHLSIVTQPDLSRVISLDMVAPSVCNI